MKNWSDFIQVFHGVEINDIAVSCENGIGSVPKDCAYSIRVYRGIWNNGWFNASMEHITTPYEVMCTPTFNTLLTDQWVESGINTDGSVTYSYYMKIDSCDDVTCPPLFLSFNT